MPYFIYSIRNDYRDDDEDYPYDNEQEDDFNDPNKLQFKDDIDRYSTVKCICLSILCFVAIVLAVAIGLFVALFYFGSLDRFMDDTTSDNTGGSE